MAGTPITTIDNGGFAERWYSMAILQDNLSAAYSFEKWKDRRPFIFDTVTGYKSWTGRKGAHRTSRLAVGFQFVWQGEVFCVTSFGDHGAHLVACTYHFDEPGKRQRVARRAKISILDLQADKKARHSQARGAVR